MTLTLTGAGLTSASSTFNPATVTGLQAWFKADAITPVADGTAIASWPDSSSNARDAAQATGANKPIYKTAVQNSLPIVRFDGAASYMATSSFTLGATGRTIVAVIARSWTTNAWKVVCGHGFGAATGTGMYVCAGGNSASVWNTGDFALMENGFNTVSGHFAAAPGLTGTAFHILSSRVDGSVAAGYVDGASKTASFSSAANAVGTTGALIVGARDNSPSDPFAGDLAEMLVFDNAISVADHTSLIAYLKAKWGTP